MSITTQRNTPSKYAPKYKSLAMKQASSNATAGTFNSVTCVAATTAVLRNRWYFKAFNSSGSPSAKRVACQWNDFLPDDYIDGTDVKIKFIWTSLATTGSVQWHLGLCQPTAGNVLGGETETQYQSHTEAASSSGTDYTAIMSSVKTYSGTNLSAGEPISVIIYRDAGVDLVGSDCYIWAVILQYESTGFAKGDTTQTFVMTPSEYPSVKKEITVDIGKTNSGAGTFNSVSVTASGVAGVGSNERWPGYDLNTGVNDGFQYNFILPEDYEDGTDITFRIDAYPENTSGGNMAWQVGLCNNGIGELFGDEATDTVYNTGTVAVSTTIFDKLTVTTTFSIPTLVAGDCIAIIFFRNGSSGSDTNTGDIDTEGIKVIYQSKNHGDSI